MTFGPNGIKEGAWNALKLDDGTDEVRDPGRYEGGLAGCRLLQRILRNGRQRPFRGDVGLRDGGPVLPNEKGAQQAAAPRLTGHHVDEAGSVEIKHRPVALQVVGHRDGLPLHVAGILDHVGLRHIRGGADDRLGADGEPAVEAGAERDAGEDGNQDRRRDRDDREQHHDPDMEPGGRTATVAGLEQSRHLAADQIHQSDDEDRIENRRGNDDAGRRRDRCQADQDEEREDGADERAAGQQQARQGERRTPVLHHAIGLGFSRGRDYALDHHITPCPTFAVVRLSVPPQNVSAKQDSRRAYALPPSNALWRKCNDAVGNVKDRQALRELRYTETPSSRIFLRRVLRFKPRRSAALI